MKIVTITAGHSNTDSGAVTKDANGKLVKEADLAVKFRNAVVSYLQKHKDITVRTDGHGTNNAPLVEAIKLIKGSDIAIELHMNASDNKTANGVESISLPKDKKISQSLSKAVADAFGSRLRGEAGWIDQSKSARGKLGYVSAGGIIVELEFISNPEQLQKFNDTYWLASKAVYVEVCKYLKVQPL